MSNFHRNRKIIALVGEQRSGKSFFANEFARNYTANGSTALVYNLGKPYDFEDAEQIEIVDSRETYKHFRSVLKLDKEALREYKEDKDILYYKNEKGDFEDIKNFNAHFYGQFLKMPRLKKEDERGFFEAWFYYISNSLLILDDCKNMFRHGLSEDILTLFSRANHTGTKHKDENFLAKGSDIIIIMHSLDQLNDDIFFYLTDIVMFKTLFEPDWSVITDKKSKLELKEIYNALREEQDFSFAILNIKSGNVEFFNPLPF